MGDDRPIWFLAPGGIPVSASSRRVPEDVKWFAKEGDGEWRPIGELSEKSDGPAAKAAKGARAS